MGYGVGSPFLLSQPRLADEAMQVLHQRRHQLPQPRVGTAFEGLQDVRHEASLDGRLLRRHRMAGTGRGKVVGGVDHGFLDSSARFLACPRGLQQRGQAVLGPHIASMQCASASRPLVNESHRG